MVVSVHIPKCAGTSFRHALRQIHGSGLWLNYGDDFRREAVPPGTTCIHGHFAADAYDGIIPGRKLITIVRHPVERVVSNYHHFLRIPDLRNQASVRLHAENLTLLQFARMESVRNEIVRYTAGKTPADFAWIGLAERYPESLVLLRKKFGISAPMTAIRDNVNPDRKNPCYDLQSHEYDEILSLNAADMVWYAKACSHFDALRLSFVSQPNELERTIARFMSQVAL